MEQKRIVFLDYLRAAACFLVVMVHANETFYGTDGILVRSEEQRLWMAIWDGVSRISVPLFKMCIRDRCSIAQWCKSLCTEADCRLHSSP